MKIILANPRGFCAGVNMAIESLERALRAVRHSPVRLSRDRPQPPGRRALPPARRRLRRPHRRRSRGAQRCSTAPTAWLRPSASRHGPAPSAGHRRHLPAGDQGPSRSRPLCPGRLHHPADRPRGPRRGRRHHGRGPEQAFVWCKTLDDVDRLDLPADAKLAYLTQTTLSVDDAEVIIAALQTAFSADRRPVAGRHLLRHAEPPGGREGTVPEADVVLVLGSQNSSNSHAPGRNRPQLRQAGLPDRRRATRSARLVYAATRRVLITAGASAPEDVVQECVAYLQDTLRRHRREPHGPRGARLFPAAA